MAHVTHLQLTELLKLYHDNYDTVHGLLNDALPAMYWAEKVCELAGDLKEADFFRDAAGDVVKRLGHPKELMELARRELIRRSPLMWASLKPDVPADIKRYIRPDLAELWLSHYG